MTVRVSTVVSSIFGLVVLGFSRTSLQAGVDIPRPQRGKALICFYREAAFQGNLFKYRVSDGSQPVGSLPANCWLFYQAESGEHLFSVSLLRRGSISLRVLPNHIYYIRCDPAAEVLYARPQMQQVPVVEGASVVGFMQND